MAKPTIVKIKRIYPNGVHVDWQGKNLLVKSFTSPGNIELFASTSAMTIYDLAHFVLGCFEPQSTFTDVKKVTFTFNNVTVTIAHDEANDNPEYIVDKWKKAVEKTIAT